MQKRQIPLVISLALILVTMTGVWVRGVPILPHEPDLPDQALSLAHLTKIRMDITPLAKLLKDNRVKISRLRKIVQEGLAEAGVLVEDDPTLPRLNLTVIASSHPEVPNGVGVTILIMVGQRATIHRLDKVFDDVPTATMVEHAMTTRNNLEKTVAREVFNTTWLLTVAIRKASNVESRTPPS